MFERIPGNVWEDEMFDKIPGKWSRRIRGNVQEESKECSTGFSAMFQNIPGYVWKDYGECLRRLRECYQRFLKMLSKNPGNVQEDSGECKFRFFLMKASLFLSNFAVNCYKATWKKPRAILLKTRQHFLQNYL